MALYQAVKVPLYQDGIPVYLPVDDRIDCFLGRARAIGILDAQAESAAVMLGEKPIEQRGASPSDVEVAGRRWRKADARRAHSLIEIAWVGQARTDSSRRARRSSPGSSFKM